MIRRFLSRIRRRWLALRGGSEVERLAAGELIVPSSFPPDDVRPAPRSAELGPRAEFDELLDKARTQYRAALDELKDR